MKNNIICEGQKMKKKLKKYRLHFVKTECYYADVQAESLDDAIDMAEDIEKWSDGSY